MKVRVERDVLADSVQWAARTLPARPPVPVLAGLYINASKEGVTLSAFDREVSSRVELPADVAEPGVTIVSGRLLAEITRLLPAHPVQLDSEGSRLSITCGRSSFTLPTLPTDEYPQLPAMPSSTGSIGGAEFASAVAHVAFAAGKDDTLPMLTGIRMEIEGSSVVLAATDRYRLAVREFTWKPESSSISTSALIPARTLGDTAKALASVDEVLIALSDGGAGEGLIGFEGNGRRTTTRLIDAAYPNFRNLLPAESSALASVDTAALIDAVKRVSIVAERQTPVKLAFDSSEVTLRAGTGDDPQAIEVLEASLDGDPIEIAFNHTFLLEGLAALGTPTVRFSFTMASKPAVLNGVQDNNNVLDDYKYLLMPIRL